MQLLAQCATSLSSPDEMLPPCPTPTLPLLSSQEKLALIVHGIGTSFSSMTPISSWVGVEIGYIQNQPQLSAKDPFVWFMESVPYRTFPISMCLFVVISVVLNADFGPMVAPEHEAMRRVRRLFPALAQREDEAEGLDPRRENGEAGPSFSPSCACRLMAALCPLPLRRFRGGAPGRRPHGCEPCPSGGPRVRAAQTGLQCR